MNFETAPKSIALEESQPTLEYDSTRIHAPVIHELVELWRYRDLLVLLVTNSIKTRYKRSALGVVWTLINPLLNTLVLTVAFSQLFRFQMQNYAIFLLSALLVWNFFSQTTTQSMNTLIWGSSLLKRIYIPRTIFAVAVAGNGLINYLLALIPLAVMMLVLKQPFTPALLLLPVVLLLMVMFTLGVSLMVSTLAVFFVDVVDMYTVLLSALFYLTPVIYPLSAVPEKFARFIRLNPLSLMVDLFRSLIYAGQAPSGNQLVIAVILSILSLLAGWWVFTRKVDELAYRI